MRTNRTKRFKKSVIIPLTLLLYLIAMSIIGLPYYRAGEYLYYFGVIGATLFLIVLLHFTLKKKEKLRQKREEEQNNNTSESKDKESGMK